MILNTLARAASILERSSTMSLSLIPSMRHKMWWFCTFICHAYFRRSSSRISSPFRLAATGPTTRSPLKWRRDVQWRLDGNDFSEPLDDFSVRRERGRSGNLITKLQILNISSDKEQRNKIRNWRWIRRRNYYITARESKKSEREKANSQLSAGKKRNISLIRYDGMTRAVHTMWIARNISSKKIRLQSIFPPKKMNVLYSQSSYGKRNIALIALHFNDSVTRFRVCILSLSLQFH